ncbi:hypothetical protein LBMAG26_17270 [Bacteroidota bacterium]|nr:hypothetical protein LBMAG26_17270 [Bacteroidota bacterium]
MLKKLKIALFVATFLIYADSMSQQFDGMSYSNYRIGSGCLTGSIILPLFSVNLSTLNSNDTISTIAATTFAATLAGPFYSYYPWSFTNNYSIITGKSNATVNFSALPSTSSITLTVKTPGIRQWSDFGLIHTLHPVEQNGCDTYKTPCDCNH